MDLILDLTWRRVAILSVHKRFENMHMVLVEKEKNGFERHILKDSCLLGNSGLPCCGFGDIQVRCLFL